MKHFLHSRRLQLMRVIIPSWRFFDQPDEPLRLEWRANTESGWTPLLTPRRRPFFSIIFNPNGNVSFAAHALLEQLISDLSDSDSNGNEIAIQVSSALVQNLVRQQLTERGALGSTPFQFRVRAAAEVLYTSEACSPR